MRIGKLTSEHLTEKLSIAVDIHFSGLVLLFEHLWREPCILTVAWTRSGGILDNVGRPKVIRQLPAPPFVWQCQQ